MAMANENTPHGGVGTPAAQWGTHDPAAEPTRPEASGFGRLVMEFRTRLGPDCTPDDVAAELRTAGVEATGEQVRAVWDKA
jgi:hypothetical protein